jgi:hypothetical protein
MAGERDLPPSSSLLATGKRSNLVIRSHELPELIVVQPNGAGIPDDEFFDGQAFNQVRGHNPLLLSVSEDRQELLFSFAPRPLFGWGLSAFHVRVSRFTSPLLIDQPRQAAEISMVG